MADQPHENLPEIRFDGSRGSYKAALVVFLVGAGFFVFFSIFEVIALTDHSSVQVGLRRYRPGIFSELQAAIFGGGGGLIALGTVALVGRDSRRNWRYWRQLRKPNAVVDGEGVRFEARHRSVSIPWSDIERLKLARFITPSRSSSTLHLQISADSTARHTAHLPLSSQRWHLIGQFEGNVNVPCNDAIEFLRHVAGSRLEIAEQFYRYRR